MAEGPVLIVEDHVDTLAALSELLGMRGYSVETAVNGAHALWKLEQISRPCLIILDIAMPVMNGVEFREELRRQPGFAEVPIVVVSANVSEGQVRQLQPAVVIKKPIIVNRLLDAVEEHCL